MPMMALRMGDGTHFYLLTGHAECCKEAEATWKVLTCVKLINSPH